MPFAPPDQMNPALNLSFNVQQSRTSRPPIINPINQAMLPNVKPIEDILEDSEFSDNSSESVDFEQLNQDISNMTKN